MPAGRTCPRCGGPTVQGFSSDYCLNECDKTPPPSSGSVQPDIFPDHGQLVTITKWCDSDSVNPARRKVKLPVTGVVWRKDERAPFKWTHVIAFYRETDGKDTVCGFYARKDVESSAQGLGPANRDWAQAALTGEGTYPGRHGLQGFVYHVDPGAP